MSLRSSLSLSTNPVTEIICRQKDTVVNNWTLMALKKHSHEKYFSMTNFLHYSEMHSMVCKHLIISVACRIQTVQFKSGLFIHKNFRFLAVALSQEESFSFFWSAFSYFYRDHSIIMKELRANLLLRGLPSSFYCYLHRGTYEEKLTLTCSTLKIWKLCSTLPWSQINCASWSQVVNCNSTSSMVIFNTDRFLVLPFSPFL